MSDDFRRGMMVGALLVGLAVIGFVGLSKAQVDLSVYGVSKHSKSGYCEVNPGLGLSYELTQDWRAVAVRYENSLCRPSNVLGFAWCGVHWGRFCFGSAFIRVTGYQPQPIYAPIPIVSYNAGRYAIDAIVAVKEGESVIGIGLRFPL